MSYSREFRDYVLDLLESAGNLRAKPMFGGVGIYLDGVFFAVIAEDVLYFKVNDATRGEYENRGMTPFSPFADRPALRSYFEVPSELFEDSETLCLWARRSWEVASKTAKKTARKTVRRSPKMPKPTTTART